MCRKINVGTQMKVVSGENSVKVALIFHNQLADPLNSFSQAEVIIALTYLSFEMYPVHKLLYSPHGS